MKKVQKLKMEELSVEEVKPSSPLRQSSPTPAPLNITKTPKSPTSLRRTSDTLEPSDFVRISRSPRSQRSPTRSPRSLRSPLNLGRVHL